MTFSPIAIVGRGCALPGALSPDQLWSELRGGKTQLSDATSKEWGLLNEPEVAELSSRKGGYVRGFEEAFNSDLLPEKDRELKSSALLKWSLHAADQALSEAGAGAKEKERSAFILGNLSYPTRALTDLALSVWQDKASAWDPRERNMSGRPAALVAEALGLKLGGFCLDAACASSLYAIKLACDRLHDDEADLMLAGGVNEADDLYLHLGFTALKALSPTGQSRPFHRDANGLLPAQGAAVVALKRLEDAERDGNSILGVIRGIGLSNDGAGTGLLTPSEDGQEVAMRAAYESAGLSPSDIGFIECHATGTSLGDGVELRSMRRVFGSKGAVPLGSMKSNMGHLITASGAAALLKVLGAFEHGELPPTLGLDAPNPELEAGGFRVPTSLETFSGPRRAAINNFGFGGNNAHLIVEEWSGQKLDSSVRSSQERTEICVVAQSVLAGGTQKSEPYFASESGHPTHLEEPCPFEKIPLPLTRLRIPPSDLKDCIPQQTAALAVALQLGETIGALNRDRTSVLYGMQCDPEIARSSIRLRSSGELNPAALGTGQVTAPFVLGCMPNLIANRIGFQFDCRGPSFVVGAEECSGDVALSLATRALRHGEVDAVLVGAVDLSREPVHKATVGGDSIPGDAAVALVLKRKSDAEREGDTIVAELETSFHNCSSVSLEPTPVETLVCGRIGRAQAAHGLLQVAAGVELSRYGMQALGDGTVQPRLPGKEGQDSGLEVRTRSEAGVTCKTQVRVSGTTEALGLDAPYFAYFQAQTQDELKRRIVSRQAGGEGDLRLGVVASSKETFEARLAQLPQDLTSGSEFPEGVYFGDQTLEGQLAYVFTGPAGAYPRMGRELTLAFPELVAQLVKKGSGHSLREVAGWIYDEPLNYRASPAEKLWGSSYLSQLHAKFTQNTLKLKADAVIGYCSGESNALFATGVWEDPWLLRKELEEEGIFSDVLGGRMSAINESWGIAEDEKVSWASYRILAPVSAIREALKGESRVHLSMIHGEADAVIAGERTACVRVTEKVGTYRCRSLDFDFIMHCPEALPCQKTWHRLHSRPTSVPEGIRFYSHSTHDSYEVSESAVADALTGQAMGVIDFPRLIEKAYADGVRVFVEHGPLSGCTKWIKQTLGDRPHLAVTLDRYGQSSLLTVTEATAALFAAGVEVDALGMQQRLDQLRTSQLPEEKPRELHFEAHWQAPLHARSERKHPSSGIHSTSVREDRGTQVMPRAPVGLSPSVLGSPFSDLTPVNVSLVRTAQGSAPSSSPAKVHALSQLHAEYLEQQKHAQVGWLSAMGKMGLFSGQAQSSPIGAPEQVQATPAIATPSAAPAPAATRSEPAPVLKPGLTVAEAPTPTESKSNRLLPEGPTLDREGLLAHAGGEISTIFGDVFRPQDQYARQVRMPLPPLLLATRVTGLKGEAGQMGLGTIWTETDVSADDWFLHEGRMPAGILVESGQADLMLISYLGADLVNQGERVYRLLGCELTAHGPLPKPGDVLRYDIHVDGHAQQGDVRLFFFHYDCYVDEELRVSVRHGQAGFFTDEELDGSAGVLWDPEEGAPTQQPRLAKPEHLSEFREFDREKLTKLTEGKIYEVFGPGFEQTECHTRSARLQGGRMQLVHRVAEFSPDGGPWGRGYLRAELDLSRNDWFFDGHFKNDPCMPGTLMFEGGLQAMSIYMMALGFTVKRDGFRFEPVQDETYNLKCRGQAVPGAKLLTYEIFVDEIVDGPEPTLYATILGSVDGRKAFLCPRFGLKLIPSWPLEPERRAPEFEQSTPQTGSSSAEVNGFKFDYDSLLACAWGRPSTAFGPMYERFDSGEQVARLPGPPYHFMSNIAQVNGPMGAQETGSEVVAEYLVPENAWYFHESGNGEMPFCVLLEAALQPCGWLASYVGCASSQPAALVFRNLDGEGGIQKRAVRRDSGLLTTHSRLSNLSTAGAMIIVTFDVSMSDSVGEVYCLNTTFGFFPPDTMTNQSGLPTSEAMSQSLPKADAAPVVSYPSQSEYADGSRLGRGKLLCLDRLVLADAAGGGAGLGQAQAQFDVSPDQWFFKAHFFQDPVQPGSIGMEALLQTLHGLALELGWGESAASVELPAREIPMKWKYRGQVIPTNRQVTTSVEVTERKEEDGGLLLVGRGSLWVDGMRIYEVEGLSLRFVGPV